ncbi:MAG: hypothetical protein PF961_00750, partial [Planctomycetota bacterium]|nr:hypothetical protein [Planctomycetota bacterium]
PDGVQNAMARLIDCRLRPNGNSLAAQGLIRGGGGVIASFPGPFPIAIKIRTIDRIIMAYLLPVPYLPIHGGCMMCTAMLANGVKIGWNMIIMSAVLLATRLGCLKFDRMVDGFGEAGG